MKLKRLKVRRGRRGQVWVETVIYTLIGLAIIGILLAVTKPQIDKMKDRLMIEQTIESLNKIDAKIFEVRQAPGNKRLLEIKISRGSLTFDCASDSISWVVDSDYKYSEIGEEINLGSLVVLTEGANPYVVTLRQDYPLNLTCGGMDIEKEISGAATPYSVLVESVGSNVGDSWVDVVVG